MINKMDKYDAIREVINDLKAKIPAQAGGHYYTAIHVLEEELSILRQELQGQVEKAVAKIGETLQ
jgi:hypothetical protein